jgi:hypothetical protein
MHYTSFTASLTLTVASYEHKTSTGAHIVLPETLRNSVRFEVLTAVTMKNAVFWYIKTHFVLHRRHITSPLQSPAA